MTIPKKPKKYHIPYNFSGCWEVVVEATNKDGAIEAAIKLLTEAKDGLRPHTVHTYSGSVKIATPEQIESGHVVESYRKTSQNVRVPFGSPEQVTNVY